MILVGERAYRGGVPDEHLRAVASRTAGANVVDDRPADVFEQRQLHPVAGLGLHHRQPVAGPVQIAEPEPFDVDAAQPEPGDQQNDGVISFAARVAAVDRLQDLGHVSRVPHRRDPGLPARLRRRDRLQHSPVDQPVAAGEPQERPYGAQFVLYGLGLVAGQGSHERADDPGVQPGQAAPPAGEGEELTCHRRIRPHRRCGAVAGLQPRLEPGQHVGLAGGQLAHGPGITAQHRPMDREIVEHLRDAEQVHIGRFERARPAPSRRSRRTPRRPTSSPDPAKIPAPHGMRRISPGGASSPGTTPSSRPYSPDAPTRHPGQTPVREQPPSTADLQSRRPGTMPGRVIRVLPDYAQCPVVTTAPTSGNPRALRITQRCS